MTIHGDRQRKEERKPTGMHMEAERRIPRPIESVWAALNDLEVLKACIPGCHSLERKGDGAIAAEVMAKVGPVKAKFKGRLSLTDLDPPNAYRLTGEGEGGAAGFAKGSANVRLRSEGADTILNYSVDATVGGKLAQLGGRLIDAAARQFAEDFFARFSAHLAAPPPPPAAEEEAAAERSSLRALIWVPALIALVLAILLLFNRL